VYVLLFHGSRLTDFWVFVSGKLFSVGKRSSVATGGAGIHANESLKDVPERFVKDVGELYS
jgi:hypothetical protein